MTATSATTGTEEQGPGAAAEMPSGAGSLPSPRALLEPLSPRDKKAAEDAKPSDSPILSPEGRRNSLLARIGDADERILNIDAVVEDGQDIDNTG